MAELTTLARPYARAAFDYADSKNMLAEWSKTLKTLVAICSNENVQLQLDNPAATADDKSQILIGIGGDELDTNVQNFVRNLAANKRLGLIDEISNLFDLYKARREQVLDVRVDSAFDISESEQKVLSDALTKNLKRQVTLECNTDASLIGGALVHAGDTLIDGTVKGRLAKLAEAMNS